MKNAEFKKLDTRGHFTDFWHNAKSWRDNKKIGARNERHKLNSKIRSELNEKYQKQDDR